MKLGIVWFWSRNNGFIFKTIFVIDLLEQWLKGLNFLGITFLVGKISRSNGFISGLHSLSELITTAAVFLQIL